MRKILVTTPTYSKYSSLPKKKLEDAGFEILWIPEATHEQISENIAGMDAILVGLEQVTEDIIERATKLKVIGKHGVGIDNIALEAATKRGIKVINAPGANSDAVADYAFGLILSVARSIHSGANRLNNKEWPKIIGKSVWGATLGIIGLGAIGKGVARRAKGFDMKILAYDNIWDEEFVKKYEIEKASLERLLRESDFVSLHVSLNNETVNMISKKQFNQMKKTAILINTSRGGLVNEEDLYQAIQEGVIAGAGVDAFSQEPLMESPLLGLENVLATPHLATYTQEALTNMSLISTEKILEVFNENNGCNIMGQSVKI